jgi:hypothetical protein
VPERILKIDGEIFRIQQKLNELPPAEEAAALKNKIAELEKQRAEILNEMEKAARGRIK